MGLKHPRYDCQTAELYQRIEGSHFFMAAFLYSEGSLISVEQSLQACLTATQLPKYLNLMMDTAPTPILVIDASGLIVSLNKAAEKKWTIDRNLFIGKPLVDILYGGKKFNESGQYLSPIIESLEKKIEMQGKEVAIRTLSCEGPSMMMVTTSILQDDRGNMVGVCAVYHDLTRSKLLENQLEDLNAEVSKCYDEMSGLNTRLVALNSRALNQHLETIQSFAEAIGARDIYTRGHSERVAGYAEVITRDMGLPVEMVETAGLAGIVHDIGKIGVSESILVKPGALTPDEFEQVKKHPSIGAKILSHMNTFHHIVPVVLHHHERYDGTGYPKGLKGEEIPLLSRVLAVADAFDAMMSTRSYRRAYSFSQAKEELKKNAGTQFDPDVVEVFINIIKAQTFIPAV